MATDHGQLCFSKSISPPSACARSDTRRSGNTGTSNRSLCPRMRNAPSVWAFPPERKISYSVLRGNQTCVGSTTTGCAPKSPFMFRSLSAGGTVSTVVQSIIGSATFTSSASIADASSAGARWLWASPLNHPRSAMFTQRLSGSFTSTGLAATVNWFVSGRYSFPRSASAV